MRKREVLRGVMVAGLSCLLFVGGMKVNATATISPIIAATTTPQPTPELEPTPTPDPRFVEIGRAHV